jgi:beta-glucosidase
MTSPGPSHVPLGYSSAEELVFAALRRDIVRGDLEPARPLPLAWLAERYGVSTMPIRAAMRRLEAEGLVRREPHRGATVAPIELDDLEEIQAIRSGIEAYAARLAAEHMTRSRLVRMRSLLAELRRLAERGDRDRYVETEDALHDLCYTAAGRSRLVRLCESYRQAAERYIRLAAANPAGLRGSLAFQERLVEACESRDGAAAEQAVRDGLRWTVDQIAPLLFTWRSRAPVPGEFRVGVAHGAERRRSASRWEEAVGEGARASVRATGSAKDPLDGAFPRDFAWGAATSAYQIEGAAREDGKGESIWDRFTALPGTIADGSSGEVATDHYHRWREDVALMAGLGLRAYRFSVAWTRVLPAGRGAVNQKGLDFYDRLVDGLMGSAIEPWLTLYHWDLPAVLEDAGGWPERATADAFAEFADVVARRLGDRVHRWITLNEPWEIGFLGYHRGVHAPGRRDLRAALAAIHTALVAHGRACQAIRAAVPAATGAGLGAGVGAPAVGIAIDPSACYPYRQDAADRAAVDRMDGHINRWFLDPLYGRGYPPDIVELYGDAAPEVADGDEQLIAQPLDFLGINYYFSLWVSDDPTAGPLRVHEVPPPTTVPRTGLGWAIHPEGLLETLRRIHEEYRPASIVITESGAAFDDRSGPDGQVDDADRIDYHTRYLRAVLSARRTGVPVDGYFAWSLLDNFEWASGYGPRFGLVRVDHTTLQRQVKASGRWYARLIAEGRLPDGR